MKFKHLIRVLYARGHINHTLPFSSGRNIKKTKRFRIFKRSDRRIFSVAFNENFFFASGKAFLLLARVRRPDEAPRLNHNGAEEYGANEKITCS